MAAKMCLNFIASFIPINRAAKVSIALIASNQIIGATSEPIRANIRPIFIAISICQRTFLFPAFFGAYLFGKRKHSPRNPNREQTKDNHCQQPLRLRLEACKRSTRFSENVSDILQTVFHNFPLYLKPILSNWGLNNQGC